MIPSPNGGILLAWPPAAAEKPDGRELKDPKYSPALERDHPGDPHPSCCLCSVRKEVPSTQ